MVKSFAEAIQSCDPVATQSPTEVASQISTTLPGRDVSRWVKAVYRREYLTTRKAAWRNRGNTDGIPVVDTRLVFNEATRKVTRVLAGILRGSSARQAVTPLYSAMQRTSEIQITADLSEVPIQMIRYEDPTPIVEDVLDAPVTVPEPETVEPEVVQLPVTSRIVIPTSDSTGYYRLRISGSGVPMVDLTYDYENSWTRFSSPSGATWRLVRVNEAIVARVTDDDGNINRVIQPYHRINSRRSGIYQLSVTDEGDVRCTPEDPDATTRPLIQGRNFVLTLS